MTIKHILTPSLLALAGTLLISTAQAQLIIATPNVQTLITFDADTPGIYQARTGTGNMRNISEPDAFDLSTFNANKASSFLTGGVASAHQFTAGYTGSGNGSPTRFQADANGDGTTNQNVGNVSQRVWRPDETSPLQGGNPTGDYSQLSSNALRLSVNAGFDSSAIFFRIQNNTGSTIKDWQFTSDIFYFEPDANSFSNLTFSYAIDNGVNPAAMTFTGFGTAPAITQGVVLSSLAGTLNQTVTTAGVANGDYIVLAFKDTTGNSGSTIFLDNIGVTGVIPEPGTYALFGGLVLLGITFLRRRR
ncbi:MAG: PEP-CTERM sorting domain-containing protein [Verrucomicrobiota bacterium]|nr:PEP-CTERM sorting domain-containing protein [Verrucomicrobiota bacterium]